MGDKVLVALGECLRKNFSQDLAGRIGGDEFILYLACDGKARKPCGTSFPGCGRTGTG